MRNTLLLALAAAACSTAHADRTDRVEVPRATADPAALSGLLAEWDRTSPGPARDRLEAYIDRLAGQRYATTSRLSWHQDLAAAQAEARRTGRPILSLRLLGRLDEDLSCANSRLFRVVLYANEEVSRTMRDGFVLHWSSVRPAPRVTIDMGDGRSIVRTVTGNSAHYVLDSAGRPIDVLPGLYVPAVFARELRSALALARRVEPLGETERAAVLAEVHRARLVERQQTWGGLRAVSVPLAPVDAVDAAVAAQLVTTTKSGMELPLYRAVDLGPRVGELPDDVRAWAQLGARLQQPEVPVVAAPRLQLQQRTNAFGVLGARREVPEPAALPGVLDARSRALLARLEPADWSSGEAARGTAFDTIVARLGRDVLADTAVNEYQVRPRIHERFTERAGSFAELDEWLYREVFRTPRTDPWLGLGGVFSALPRDGVATLR